MDVQGQIIELWLLAVVWKVQMSGERTANVRCTVALVEDFSA